MTDLFQTRSVLIFIASMFIALAAWASALPPDVQWADLTTVQNVFAFFGTIGAVLAAWLGKSPLTKM